MVACGARDPRKVHPGAHLLDKEFQDLYKRYKDEDPPPRSQHAVPNTTIRWTAAFFSAGSQRQQTGAALIVLAYFFLLRVGEYTPTRNTSRKKRTIPLRKGDVTLLRNNQPMDREAPLAELLTATGCTICLENQKNGHKDETIFHEATPDPIMCPVKAMALLLDKLRGRPADTPLGTFFEGNRSRRVNAADTLAMIRHGAIGDNLEAEGYDLSRIGTHSIRASGAVRLKLAGYNDTTIKKLGRWSSDTFLQYIQPHIAPLTEGCAARMAEPLRYLNVFAR